MPAREIHINAGEFPVAAGIVARYKRRLAPADEGSPGEGAGVPSRRSRVSDTRRQVMCVNKAI